MPAYNGEPYLNEAIDSILGQSFGNFELLIANDASTDKTEEIILSYNDPRIRYIKNEANKGIILTRNLLIEEARGQYLAIFDSDDISYPERLKKQVVFLDQHLDYSFCGTWGVLIDSHGKRLKQIKLAASYEEIKCGLIFSNTFIQSSMMIRRSILGEGLRYDSEFPVTGDFEFWCRLIKEGKAINISEPLVAYRWHAQNISHAKKDNAANLAKRTYKRELEYIGIHPDDMDLKIHLAQNKADDSIPDKEFLQKEKAWLKKIAQTARIDGIYDKNTFLATVAFRWIFVCKEKKAYLKMINFPIGFNCKSLIILFKMLAKRL